MEYTQSDSFTIHTGTGNRMHDSAKPIPTAVSDKDLNMVIWSLMEVVKAAGQTPMSFDPSNPASYSVIKNALDTIYTQEVAQICLFPVATAPAGFLKCNGANVSRTTYAKLFARIGTTFGAGDGWSTFTLPDLRGEFIRGWDDGRGVDVGRLIGSWQAGQMPSHTHRVSTEAGTNGGANLAQTDRGYWNYLDPRTTEATGGTENGSENRPRNLALLACIKY